MIFDRLLINSDPNQRLRYSELPPSPWDANVDLRPSIKKRASAPKEREHQATLWTPISDPLKDSASQRARLDRYMTEYRLISRSGGSHARGAYKTTGTAKPHPSSAEKFKQRKYRAGWSVCTLPANAEPICMSFPSSQVACLPV